MMDNRNPQVTNATVNVRESKFILKSEVLDEVSPMSSECLSEQTDNDGSDKHDDRE